MDTWFMNFDQFEWPEDKRLKVLKDRGLDFIRATAIFDGRPVLSEPSPRADEERWLNVAELNGQMVAVVWCWRGEKIQIITMRRARHAEERRYRELYT
jgi:uncharacterized DUF497 family protein